MNCGETISNNNLDASYSLTHSLDRLTGDGSLRPPDFTITGHIPGGSCSKPDVDLQLADPRMSRTATRTLPVQPVVRSDTCTGVDCQTKCLVRGNRLL